MGLAVSGETRWELRCRWRHGWMDRWDEVHTSLALEGDRWNIFVFVLCFCINIGFGGLIPIIYRKVTTAYIEEMYILYPVNLPMHGGRFVIDQ
ncbi:C2HC5 zinc finger domain-containing protein [Histoplasma ohiense]|nr:C2HC5 zinc finger domain-containing protein [Histoplasma ohiense (nom. inval.)]